MKNIFEGKSPAERNKMIAAMVLGCLAVLALGYTLSGLFWPSKKSPVTTNSPSPTPKSVTQNIDSSITTPVPSLDSEYAYTAIDYRPFSVSAPDAGRNIFAFYEPPPPTPYVEPTPKPIVIKPTPTPTPIPPPPQMVGMIIPTTVFARTADFNLQVNGDKFTPETQILFGGTPLQTRFVSPQQLMAVVPAYMITGEGQRQIMTRTPDGKIFSNPVIFNVMAPPVPTYQYIGLVARKRYNNDTAVLVKKGGKDYLSVRLNDTIEGRFRIVSISEEKVVVEDTQLKFRHELAYQKPSQGGGGGQGSGNQTYMDPNSKRPQTYDPYQQQIPGIPDSIPRYNPQQKQDKKDDVDDDDDDNDN
jgi:hypothetical protein